MSVLALVSGSVCDEPAIHSGRVVVKVRTTDDEIWRVGAAQGSDIAIELARLVKGEVVAIAGTFHAKQGPNDTDRAFWLKAHSIMVLGEDCGDFVFTQ